MAIKHVHVLALSIQYVWLSYSSVQENVSLFFINIIMTLTPIGAMGLRNVPSYFRNDFYA